MCDAADALKQWQCHEWKAMSNPPSPPIESAIVGLFAAIKICRRLGYDPAEVLRIVEQMTEEWGLLPEKQATTDNPPRPHNN
jgi:hypothetical protein